LSADKTELFSTAIGAYLDIICETFNNQAIPQLIDLNGSHFNGLTDYPRLRHGDVDNKDLTSLGSFLKDMVGTGIIIPDESIEDYVRDAANLPERTEIPDGRGADPIREALRRAQIGVPMDDNEEEDQERSSGGRRVNPKDQEAGADEDAGGGTAGSRPRQKKPTRRRTEDEEGF
jgi:phage gp29-like protein